MRKTSEWRGPSVNWRFMYGLLVDELKDASSSLPVGGDTSSVNYISVKNQAVPGMRVPIPAGFTGGTMLRPDGRVFVLGASWQVLETLAMLNPSDPGLKQRLAYAPNGGSGESVEARNLVKDFDRPANASREHCQP